MRHTFAIALVVVTQTVVGAAQTPSTTRLIPRGNGDGIRSGHLEGWLPPRSMNFLTTVTTASFDVNPLFLMMRWRWSSLMELPARNRMSVLARSSDTFTDSTSESFCTATRTAWAQTAQSMPSAFSSTRRNSANATEGIGSDNSNASSGVLREVH